MLHLVTLGAGLRERGIGLRVIEQGIDTATAEGRAMPIGQGEPLVPCHVLIMYPPSRSVVALCHGDAAGGTGYDAAK